MQAVWLGEKSNYDYDQVLAWFEIYFFLSPTLFDGLWNCISSGIRCERIHHDATHFCRKFFIRCIHILYRGRVVEQGTKKCFQVAWDMKPPM
jgi:hypothetical protein